MNTCFNQLLTRITCYPLVVILAFLASCGSNESKTGSSGDHMSINLDSMKKHGEVIYDAAGLLKERAEKDENFKSEGSPLPDGVRGEFHGLSYYAPAVDMMFTVPLVKFSEPKTIEIAATKGDVRKMLRYGTFTFQVDGQSCTLTAYKSEADPGMLFVPFKDATNGKETYRVGRYLDMKEHAGDAPYLIDFNQAYNPYCAYNDNYTCPLVPGENVLPVAIHAGEKLPSWGDH
jgi:uncharacterized protein (DUF1684 family)